MQQGTLHGQMSAWKGPGITSLRTWESQASALRAE